MTIDISELIRNIRAYAAARDAYDNDRSEDNGLALEKATAMLTGEYYAGEEIREAFVALADHCERLQTALHDNNVVLETLHTEGAKANYPGYLIGMGDLYELQAQIDANNELLGIEPK